MKRRNKNKLVEPEGKECRGLLTLGSLLPFLLVSIFVFLRLLLYYNQFLGREVYLKYDEAIYAMLSQRFLAGDLTNALNPYWNAGFPIFTIPFYLLTRQWEDAQFLVSVTAHTLLVFVLYFTLRRTSQFLAILSAFLLAFSSPIEKLFVLWGGVTEPLYLLFFWLAIYFSWQGLVGKKIKNYALSGLFFGLAYFTRTEVIYTMVIFLLITFLSFIFKKRTEFTLRIFTNKITIGAVIGAILVYLYSPLTKLAKFTTLKFLIVKSARSIFFASLFLLAALLGLFFERKQINLFRALKQIAPRIGVVIAIFLLVNATYIAVISINLGRPTLSGKYAYLRSGHQFTPEPDRLTTWAQDIWSIDFPNYRSPYYDSTKLLPVIWKNLDNSLEAAWKRIGTNLGFYAYDNIFSNLLAWLTLFGFLAALLQRRFSFFALYLGVLWLGSFAFIAYFMDSAFRYLAFSFPIFYVYQAFAILVVGQTLSKINRSLLPITLITFCLFFFSKNVDTDGFRQVSKTNRYSDQKIIGDWLKEKGIDLIMARTEGISFYSGAKMIYMPAANPQTIIKFAKGWGVEYLLARPVESSWDYMRPIVNPNFNHPDLALKHQFEEGTLIWKVKLTEEEKLYNFRTDQDVNKRFDDINIDSQIKI